MKTIKELFGERGLTMKAAARLGIPYDTISSHFQGKRTIGVKAALRYEALLGIPRWELRPDLWEAPDSKEAGA